MHKTHKKRHLKVIIAVATVSGAIFAILLILVLGVYYYNWNSKALLAAEKIIPFPAFYIPGAGSVSVNEVKADGAAVQKFYESPDFEKLGMRVDFSTEQGQKRLKIKEKEVLNKLIENTIIKSLAKKRDISISDAIVDQEVDSSINQFGNRQNLMSELARLYGWTLDDFKQKIVKPELYAEKLTEAYVSEVDTTAQQAKIKTLYERVTAKKEDFAKVASESSEGQSAENNGDLGWSTQDQLVPEISDKAFSMKPGDISEAIASPLGFHIIKLDEKKNDNGQDLVHLRQIFVKTPTFADWLKVEMKKFKVMVFLRDYQWNSDSAMIEFKKEDLKKFEQNLDVNSEGDPSIF